MASRVRVRFNKLLSAAIILSVSFVVINDSKHHFDAELVALKRKHRSPQNDWSVFYGQRFVYYSTSMRYERDFLAIANLVRPHSLVISDLATSYYSAAYLPVYVRNVHRHQGRDKSVAWRRILDSRQHCYLQRPENVSSFVDFVRAENRVAAKAETPVIRYVLVNNDLLNNNPRYDCFWNGRQAAIENLEAISTKLYVGEYLILYEFNK